MTTAVQIIFFIFFSPAWILGLVLFVDGRGRRKRAKLGLASISTGPFVGGPIDEPNAAVRRKAKTSLVGAWLMMVTSIVPLGASLISLPRPSVVVFGMIAVRRIQLGRRRARLPPPPTEADRTVAVATVPPCPPSPPRPVISGGRHVAFFVIPMLLLASFVSEWSSQENAAALHVVMSVFFVLPSVFYEVSRPHRGAVLVIGEVIGHKRHENEGSISFPETLSFRSGTEMFSVQGQSPKEKRPLGSSATVSYRPGEPAHARVVPDDGGRVGLLVGVVVALGCSVLLGWTSLPLLALIGVAHAHFIVKDRRRADSDGLLPLARPDASPAPLRVWR